ncbi:MAG: purine-nucleoside phosphorylase [Desulfobacteraceae bacterium]|nr:purine-nucleoside phosphorylase [Desulfobacteraceae bacterium]MBC2720361.1 purine-nucleoside phosphorylase [Desulfobacteraceae bacterium]
MKSYKLRVVETAEYLKSHINKSPEIGILTGTGLGNSLGSIDIDISFNYKNIPNFPVSTVQAHLGKLLFGGLNGKPVIAMQGRFHLYEGYSPADVTFPIRIMQKLGVKILILTNAAGGLNPDFKVGDIMIIKDHINLTGSNPLIGPNEDIWGIRFPDMSKAYDEKLVLLAENTGAKAGIRMQKGVYAGLKGPSLETPAEVRFLKTIGAEAVGFSTVQEVISAVHGGMRVLCLSTITNINDPDKPAPATIEEIISVAEKAAPELETIINDVVGGIKARKGDNLL